MTHSFQRRAAAVTAVAVLVAALAGCGADEKVYRTPNPTQSPATTALTTPDSTATSSASGADRTVESDSARPSDEVTKAFPGGNSPDWEDGYAAVYDALSAALSITDTLSAGPHPSRHYEVVREYLTPEAWTALAAAADSGDPDNLAGSLVPTTSTGEHPGTLLSGKDGKRFVPTGISTPAVIGEATLSVRPAEGDTPTGLQVTVPVAAEYSTVDGPVTRTRTVTVVATPVGDAWLVDAWDSKIR